MKIRIRLMLYFCFLVLSSFLVSAWEYPTETHGAYIVWGFDNNLQDGSPTYGRSDLIANGTEQYNATGRKDQAYRYINGSTNNYLINHTDISSSNNDTGTMCMSFRVHDYIPSITIPLSSISSSPTNISSLSWTSPSSIRWSTDGDGVCGNSRTMNILEPVINIDTWVSTCITWARGTIDSNTWYLSLTYINESNEINQNIVGFAVPHCLRHSTANNNVYWGTGSNGVAGSYDIDLDGIAYFDHNLTITELNYYHFGNWPNHKFNLSGESPSNGTSFSNPSVNINASGDLASSVTTAELYINGTLNITNSNGFPVGQDVYISFNQTFQEGHYRYFMQVYNNSVATNSSHGLFIISTPSSINISIPQPFNNTQYLSNNINFNTSVNLSFATTSAPQLFINGTLNSTSAQNFSAGSNNFISFNVTIPDGHYSFRIRIISNTTTTDSVINNFFIDGTPPGFQLYFPSSDNNVSNLNVTYNASISDQNLFNINLSVFFRNNSLLFNYEINNNSLTTTTNQSVYARINFTADGNYTFNLRIFDSIIDSEGRLNFVELNRTYYFDAITPAITISSPTGTSTSRTLNLNTSIIDRLNTTCNYRVTDSNLNSQISTTNFNCINTQFTTSIDGNFIVFVNATDGLYINQSNSSFTVDTTGGGGDSGGGGGGGGGSSTTVKEDCDISITPEKIYLTTFSTLAELKFKNQETFSLTPIYTFEDIIGETGFKNNLQITNDPGSILPKTEVSFGVRYTGSEQGNGKNKLIITTDQCNDLEIEININEGLFGQISSELFDPSQPLFDNLLKFMNRTLFSVVKVWMILGIFTLLSLLITNRIITDWYKTKRRLRLVLLIIFDIFLAFVITLVVSFIII